MNTKKEGRHANTRTDQLDNGATNTVLILRRGKYVVKVDREVLAERLEDALGGLMLVIAAFLVPILIFAFLG